MSSKIHKILTLTNKVVLAVAFVVVASAVIFSAAGYKIEFTKGEIHQTAMIAVKALPKQSILKIDNSVYDPSTTWRVPNLAPGRYNIEVLKQGYHTWSHEVNIDAGQTAIFEDVLLFLKEPVVSVVDNNSEKTKLINDLNNQKITNDVVTRDDEIYLNEKLVARYSKPIYSAKLYADEAHITFINDNKFHIIDEDGSNDIPLFNLRNDAQYLLLSGGQVVLCLEGDSLKSIKIR